MRCRLHRRSCLLTGRLAPFRYPVWISVELPLPVAEFPTVAPRRVLRRPSGGHEQSGNATRLSDTGGRDLSEQPDFPCELMTTPVTSWRAKVYPTRPLGALSLAERGGSRPMRVSRSSSCTRLHRPLQIAVHARGGESHLCGFWLRKTPIADGCFETRFRWSPPKWSVSQIRIGSGTGTISSLRALETFGRRFRRGRETRAERFHQPYGQL